MNPIFAVFGLGGGEIILILAVVLLLFGAKKLPELARGLGSGIKEFKKASNEVTDELHRATDDTPSPSAPRRLPPEGSEPSESTSQPDQPQKPPQ
jgi:sec-independent protein translocase protein TatA